MKRFFCHPQNITCQEINITDKDELHHMLDVLCLEPKEKVSVIDGRGGEFYCEIIELNKKSAKLKIINSQMHKKEDFQPRITIACAMPKRSKIDSIVEKLTEIGVEKIILLETERTEVNLADSAKKIKKLEKVMQSALKQSGNLFMPKIEFLKFNELIKLSNNFDLAIIPNLGEDTLNIRDALKPGLGNVLVAIGPEGDFSENEIELAKKSGFVSVSLGNTVLRVDTAAIVTAGFIKLGSDPASLT